MPMYTCEIVIKTDPLRSFLKMMKEYGELVTEDGDPLDEVEFGSVNFDNLDAALRRELDALAAERLKVEPNKDAMLESLVRIATLARFCAGHLDLALVNGINVGDVKEL